MNDFVYTFSLAGGIRQLYYKYKREVDAATPTRPSIAIASATRRVFLNAMSTIIFIDFEGAPIIEAAAIAVDAQLNIVGVFHGFKTAHQPGSTFATHAIQGLSQAFLRANGHRRPEDLLNSLKTWLRRSPAARLVATTLGRRVDDAGLPPWVKRPQLEAHEMARTAKLLCLKIGGVSCSGLKDAHCKYLGWPCRKTATDVVKRAAAHHCALYDCYELYLFYGTIVGEISCLTVSVLSFLTAVVTSLIVECFVCCCECCLC